MFHLFFNKPFQIIYKNNRFLVTEHGNIQRMDLHKLVGPSEELVEFIKNKK